VSRATSNRAESLLRAGGFTLIELMIALTVLGILVAAGLPSLTNLVRDQRIKTASSDVFASLIYARSEAIKRNDRVVLCAANSTLDGCSNNSNWAAGWIVFLDTDGNGFPGAVSDILRKNNALPNVTINGTATNATYMRDGRLNAAVANFTISSPDNASLTKRCIRMDPSGRPNIQVGC
jgi:type IV fimbrial biogenesis protein FimT